MLAAMDGAPRPLDRAIQRAHVRVWLTVSLIFALAVSGTAYVAWWVLARTQLDPYFLEQLSLILRANAVLLILVTLFMGLYTVLLSQRISGPSWRIQDALRGALDGRYTEVEIAEHDYLQAIANDTNSLLRRLAADQQALGRLGDELSALAEGNDELSERLTQLANRARRIAGAPESDPEEGTS